MKLAKGTAVLGFVATMTWSAAPAAAATYGPCAFNSTTLRFAGTVAETAACLLRRVNEHGGSAANQPVPPWLIERLTRPVPMTAAQLQRYLDANGIDAGALTDRVVVGDIPQVRYFVIHDTSSPEIVSSGTTFPANINDASYVGNRLTNWGSVERKVNLIVTRDGRSGRFRPWGAARLSPATKVEEDGRVPAARPLFVHVENVQPRIKPPGSWGWRAPTPGFTPAQEQRLALAYVVASMRAGRWLIPAYHFNIDFGLPGHGHDDPQHADLASWVARVQAIEAQIMAN